MPKPSADRERSYDGDYMRTGRLGESVVARWLEDDPQVIGVEDLRELRPVQGVGCDFAVYLRDGTNPLAEVKTDMVLDETGNMVFEIFRVNHTAPHDRAFILGWSARTSAKWLLVYSPQRKKIYRFETEILRQTIQKKTFETRWRHYYDPLYPENLLRWVNTDKIKSTVIMTIPQEWWEPIADEFDASEYSGDF